MRYNDNNVIIVKIKSFYCSPEVEILLLMLCSLLKSDKGLSDFLGNLLNIKSSKSSPALGFGFGFQITLF